MSFKHTWKISFGEIDYASIVYYPNFFDYFQRTEEAFMEHIGFPYPYLIGDLKLGFPIVHVESDFKKPVRYGDAIDIVLDVIALGEKSVTFAFKVFKGREFCAEATIKHVTVNLSLFQATPIPDDLRRKLERELNPS
jgi:YbgC/YbaW family acyl-CoA thioester hydrolase